MPFLLPTPGLWLLVKKNGFARNSSCPSWGLSTVLWSPMTTLSPAWTAFPFGPGRSLDGTFLSAWCADLIPHSITLQRNRLFFFLTLSAFPRAQQILFLVRSSQASEVTTTEWARSQELWRKPAGLCFLVELFTLMFEGWLRVTSHEFALQYIISPLLP